MIRCLQVGMSPGSGDFSKHSTPMAGAGAGAGAGGPGVQPTFPATPLMDSSSQSGGENPFTFSMKGSSKMTVDLIREAAMLTSNFTCPQKVSSVVLFLSNSRVHLWITPLIRLLKYSINVKLSINF